jgi:hypothetical protein
MRQITYVTLVIIVVKIVQDQPMHNVLVAYRLILGHSLELHVLVT